MYSIRQQRLFNTIGDDVRTNGTIRQEITQEYVSNYLRKKRWTYVGHILRAEGSQDRPSSGHYQAIGSEEDLKILYIQPSLKKPQLST